MGGKKNNPAKTAATPATPEPSQVAQDMIAALTYGPTGYSEDILKNLGMDVANPGYQGGGRETTGMTQGQQPFGYQANPVSADPLVPALERGAATPTDVNDLFMKYAGGTKATPTAAAPAAPSRPQDRDMGGYVSTQTVYGRDR